MPSNGSQNTGFALILVGSILSFGRVYLSDFFIRVQAWLRKQTVNPKLKPAVMLYLMLTGMILTVLGVLMMLGVLPG